MKSLSLSQLHARRAEIARALGEVAELEFWNAGGSGSVEASADDPVVTEIAAGSGLLVPAPLRPLPVLRARARPRSSALPVVRRPSPQVATVHGGGLVASGPAGDDRLPVPWAPAGLHLSGLEGAGEVQTPLTGHPAAPARDRRPGVVPARQVRRAVRAHQHRPAARRAPVRRRGPDVPRPWPGLLSRWAARRTPRPCCSPLAEARPAHPRRRTAGLRRRAGRVRQDHARGRGRGAATRAPGWSTWTTCTTGGTGCRT